MNTFKTVHNRYLSARGETEGWVIGAEVAALLDWEKFTLVPLEDGKIALKTAHKRYVTALGGDRGFDLIAETKEIGAFERFEVVPVGGCTQMLALLGLVPW